MTKRVPKKPAHDFSELERAFFESAPPEVPVAPAEPLRFDDLVDESARPQRLRPRVERRRQPRALDADSSMTARLHVARRAVVGATARLGRDAWSRGRAWSADAWSRGRAWSLPHWERGRRRLVAGLATTRAAWARRGRAILARLAAELPGERLQGKTLAAMVAVVVFVVITAGVVAQRPALSAPRAAPTATARP